MLPICRIYELIIKKKKMTTLNYSYAYQKNQRQQKPTDSTINAHKFKPSYLISELKTKRNAKSKVQYHNS